MEKNTLFSEEELKQIEDHKFVGGFRIPIWYPFFNKPTRAIDYVFFEALDYIYNQENGAQWVKGIKSNLLDFNDVNNMSSAIAEIRAYGGLLKAGFNVKPISRTKTSTPDFSIDAGDGEIILEVFSKHQDKESDQIMEAMSCLDKNPPEGIERRTDVITNIPSQKQYTMISTISSICPGGRPDPNKKGDSVQANLISKICSSKGQEKQLPSDKPTILVIDFANFGGPVTAEFMSSEQATPLITWRQTVCSGAVWYALYGWKNAPIFSGYRAEKVEMGHDGKFRTKTKISAVLAVFSESVVLLENPWCDYPLPPKARHVFLNYPRFDLTRSILNIGEKTAKMQLEVYQKLIESVLLNYQSPY